MRFFVLFYPRTSSALTLAPNRRCGPTMVANTIHDVFQPFYQCGKLLGLFCYTFDRPSQGSRSSAVTAASTPTTDDGLRARTSVWNVVLLLLNVCYVLLCMVYVNMGDEITEMQTVRSLVLDQSFRFTFKYGIVFTLVTYAWMFVFRKRVAGIVCELGRVDAEVSGFYDSIEFGL